MALLDPFFSKQLLYITVLMSTYFRVFVFFSGEGEGAVLGYFGVRARSD